MPRGLITRLVIAFVLAIVVLLRLDDLHAVDHA